MFQGAIDQTVQLCPCCVQRANAVWDAWGQSEGWSEPLNPPVAQSGSQELHRHPAADTMQYTSQVNEAAQFLMQSCCESKALGACG